MTNGKFRRCYQKFSKIKLKLNFSRYLVLHHMPRERTDMIMIYLEDLEKRGAPAPITAPTFENNARRK